MRPLRLKDLDWDACRQWVQKRQAKGQRVVFTNGCFDLIHAGHIHLLAEARGCGDHLVVGLNSDASIRRLKGPGRPVTSLQDRILILSALTDVDAVVVFPRDRSAETPIDPELADTPWELLKGLRPDVLVKGSDYAPDDIVGREFAKIVKIVELLEGRSTAKLLSKLERP